MSKIRYIQYFCFLLIACKTALTNGYSPICLTAPFITSIFDIQVQAVNKSKNEVIYNLKFILESNYDSSRIVIVDKVILNNDLTINDKSDPTISFVNSKKSAEIVYSRWIYHNNVSKVWGSELFYLHIEKKLEQIHRERYNFSANNLGNYCDLHINGNRALVSFRQNETHILHLRYFKSQRCTYVLSDTSYPVNFNQVNDNKGYPRETNIISAFIKIPFNFEFTSDGYLILSKSGPEAKSKVFKLAGMPGNSKDSLFENKICGSDKKIKPDFEKGSLKNHYMEGKPIQTFTMLNKNSYVGCNSVKIPPKSNKPCVIWQRKDSSSPFIASYDHQLIQTSNEQNPKGYYSLEAISITRLEEKKLWQVQTILVDHTIKCQKSNKCSIIHSIDEVNELDLPLKVDLGAENAKGLDQKIYPDDITHWTKCKKVVSFYGFMYSLHEYNDNILTKPTIWHILPKEHFLFPIDAVHSNGDEFWFFIKLTTVMVFKVNSSDCSKLNFIKKRILNIEQLFSNSSKSVMIEGRYYANGTWNPSWDWLPSGEWIDIGTDIDTDADNSLLWLYVGIFVTVVALAIIIVLMVIDLRKPGDKALISRRKRGRSPNKRGSKSAASKRQALIDPARFGPALRSKLVTEKSARSPLKSAGSPRSPVKSAGSAKSPNKSGSSSKK